MLNGYEDRDGRMDNNYEELREKVLDRELSKEELLLRHTHTIIAEYSFKTRQLDIYPKEQDFVREDKIVADIASEHSFHKLVFKPDLPLYERLTDFSGLTGSVWREANIRLYVKPHICEWFHIALLYYADVNGEKERVVIAFTNAEKELEAVSELNSLVTVDSLTQLPNINTFSMQTWELLESNPEREYAIVRMDMRKFRLLNEYYGTQEGDNVLRFMGVKLQECMDLEELYTYCHLTADIFAVCMSSNIESINRVIDNIQTSMKQYPVNFEFVMSFGIYIITEKDKQERLPVVTMVDRAAIAQRVKNNYINKIAVFDEKTAEKEYAEQNVIMEMNNALDSGQFHIYMQPKVDVKTEEIIGSEALVRWIHPVKGLISPVDFVPIFESNGFITALDYYILEQVCKAIRSWLDKGIDVKPVSVNLSRSNLYSQNVLDNIMTCVQKYNVPHWLLEFEITESAFAVDNLHLNHLLEQLQCRGFKVLMDDFGSGYSSLNALRELNVDTIKIDIEFLPVHENDKRAEIILKNVTQMARELELDMVVEGVETQAHADLLKRLGCGAVQGFLYYRPMPLKEYELLLIGK